MEKYESSEQYKTSGLDMRETLEWYKSSGIEMPPFPEMDFSHPIENQELIELSERELGGLFTLFSENARKRSILRKVVGQPPTWFHKDSTSEQPKPTTNEAEAMSSTAIAPSYIDYTPWGKLKNFPSGRCTKFFLFGEYSTAYKIPLGLLRSTHIASQHQIFGYVERNLL